MWSMNRTPSVKKLIDINTLPLWPAYYEQLVQHKKYQTSPAALQKLINHYNLPNYPIDPNLNNKIILYRGDITAVQVDGVVNAANSGLW
jgi:hypothetical protein